MATHEDTRHSSSEALRLGIAMRRKILGDAYGARLETTADADARSADKAQLTSTFTELAAQHLWAAIWPRKGLDERSRRIATIGVLIMLGCKEELTLHFDAAIAAGDLTKDEIQEIILHSTSYTGYPIALSALNQVSDPD